MRNWLKKIHWRSLIRLGIRYLFWGAVSYGLAFGITWLFTVILGLGDRKGYACVQIIIFPINYLLAKNHIFEAPQKEHRRCVVLYTASSLGCRVFDWIVFNILRMFGIPRSLAVLMSLIIVYPTKFILYKFVVFK